MRLKQNADILHHAKCNGKGGLSTYVLAFYVTLVQLLFTQGKYDSDNGQYTIYCTPGGLAALTGSFPAKRVRYLLVKLSQNGLITYTPKADVPDKDVCGVKPLRKAKPIGISADLSPLIVENERRHDYD